MKIENMTLIVPEKTIPTYMVARAQGRARSEMPSTSTACRLSYAVRRVPTRITMSLSQDSSKVSLWPAITIEVEKHECTSPTQGDFLVLTPPLICMHDR